MNQIFLLFLSILFFHWRLVFSSKCPDVVSINNIQQDNYEYISLILEIPRTNIVLSSSVILNQENARVYYVDTSTLQGQIISIVEPEFSIRNWAYSEHLNQIIVLTNSMIAVVDPYSLKTLYSNELSELFQIFLIKGTKYALVTLWYYTLNIIDTETLEIYFSCDNRVDENQIGAWQYYLYQTYLKDGSMIVFISGKLGVFTWTINLETQERRYNSFLPYPLTNEDLRMAFFRYESSSIDLFFFVGVFQEIRAIEIVDIATQQYQIWSDAILYISENIIYDGVFKFMNGVPTIYVLGLGAIFEIILNIDEQNKTITFEGRRTFSSDSGQPILYSLLITEYSNKIYIGSQSLYKFDVNLSTFSEYLSQISKNQRRFKYEENGYNNFVSCDSNQVLFYNDEQYGKPVNIMSLSASIISSENSSYKVLNCDDCLLIRSGSSILYKTTLYYSNDNPESFDLGSIGLTWGIVGELISPFQEQSQIYIVVGFSKNQTSFGYLFLLINTSTSATTELKVDIPELTDLNSNISSYAIISLEDPNNQEIIGIDLIGNIYFWDYKPPYQFKDQVKISYCMNSRSGDVFHYNTNKWVIIGCENYDVIVYNVKTKTSQLLLTLTSQSQIIRAFRNPMIITIDDYKLGYLYIFRFNKDLELFTQTDFLLVKPSYIQDKIIWVELLKDQTLWLQYNNKNVFFEIMACSDNFAACLSCELDFYFNASLMYDSQALYGQGTQLIPFTTSENLFFSFMKAHLILETISSVESITINISVNPENEFLLIESFLSVSFCNNIQLIFSSQYSDNHFKLKAMDKIQFSNYQRISLSDVEIVFDLSNATATCGLNFSSISNGVVIQDIALNNMDSKQQCFKIVAIASDLFIKSLTVSDIDFSSESFVFDLRTSSKLNIEGLLIKNCTFSDQGQFVKSSSTLQFHSTNITIEESKCSLIPTSSVTVPFFEAGVFNVKQLNVLNNSFCNKVLFSILTSSSQSNSNFIFDLITMKGNKFRTSSETIFLTSKYSTLTIPLNALELTNSQFANNILIFQDNMLQIELVKLLIIEEIKNVVLKSIDFIDHTEISLGSILNSDSVIIQHFNCSSTVSFYENSSIESKSNPCLELIEIQSAELTQITIERKKVKDKSLLSFKNKISSDSTLSISESYFNSNLLKQSQTNKKASPISIVSKNKLTITIDTCRFYDNRLDGLTNAFIYGTTAIWIENYLGNISIIDSTFQRAYSNSKFNVMNMDIDSAFITNSIFSGSQFTKNYLNNSVNYIEGGFIRGTINEIEISECEFQDSYALQGSFLYLQTVWNSLKVSISETLFSNGFSSQAGGAIFIDSKASQLTFSCTNCQFFNIHTMRNSDSAIAVQSTNNVQTLTNKNRIVFEGGKIQNIFGVENTNFISVSNTELVFSHLEQINADGESLSDQLELFFSKDIFKLEQSCLINAISDSSVTLDTCYIFDLENKLQTTSQSLFINTIDSTVDLINIIVKDSTFSSSFIDSDNVTLSIHDSTFSNINLISKQRNLLLNEETPLSSAPSLIKLKKSYLISNLSEFSSINCPSCNGAVFQLLDTQLQLQSTYINNSNVFNVVIKNSKIQKNSAINGEGGALYIRSQDLSNTDQTFQIINSEISGNSAQAGGGIDFKSIHPTIDSDSKIFKNSAQLIGQDKLSYPTHLTIKNIDNFLNITGDSSFEKNKLTINNFRSGSTLNEIVLSLESDLGEEIIPITSSDLSQTVDVAIATQNEMNKVGLRGVLSTGYNNGYIFSDLAIVGIPGKSTSLLFSSPLIQVFSEATQQYSSDYSFEIVLNVRECVAGEIINTYGDFLECNSCKQGYYSFDIQQCYECPADATCSGGTNIAPNPGYWKRNSTSTEVISCENSSTNCLGEHDGNNSCYEGHIGALCEECDIYGEHWEASYSKLVKFKCVNCAQIKNNLWVIALILICTQVSMTLAIKGDIEMLEEKAAGQILKRNLSKKRTEIIAFAKKKTQETNSINLKKPQITRLFGQTSTSTVPPVKQDGQSKTDVLIKMLTNYFQIISSLSTFNLTIPLDIITVPSSIGQPLQHSMNSLDCALKDIDTTIPIIYLRLMFSLLTPIVYLMFFMIWVIALFLMNKKRKNFPYYILSTAAMFLLIYIQPDLVSQTISLMSCRKIGDIYYIKSNVNFECYTADYYTYSTLFLIPLLILVVLIIPLSLYTLLNKNKNELDNTQIKLKYGFLYKEYKNNAFYWEFVKMMEKLIIIISLTFYSQQIVTKGILVFITISLYSIVSFIVKPYKEEDTNLIDVNSTNVCAITVLLGLFLYKNDFWYFMYPTVIIMIAINVWFFYSVCRRLFHGIIEKISTLLDILLKRNIKLLSFLNTFRKNKPIRKVIKPELRKKFKTALQSFAKKGTDAKKDIVEKIIAEQIEQSASKFLTSIKKDNERTKSIFIFSPRTQDNQLRNESSMEDLQDNIDPKEFLSFQTLSPRISSPRIQLMNSSKFISSRVPFDKIGLTPVNEEIQEVSQTKK